MRFRYDFHEDDFDQLSPQDRSTDPDLTSVAAITKKHCAEMETRRKILQNSINTPHSYARREEVLSRIILHDHLRETELKNIRLSSNDTGDQFMEFHSENRPFIYVYFKKEYTHPSYLTSDHDTVPLNHPGATVLLKIDARHGTVTEIHRWEDEKKE